MLCNILYYGYDIVYYLLHTLDDPSNPVRITNQSTLFENNYCNNWLDDLDLW
jgi:hypothetical protein